MSSLSHPPGVFHPRGVNVCYEYLSGTSNILLLIYEAENIIITVYVFPSCILHLSCIYHHVIIIFCVNACDTHRDLLCDLRVLT